MLRIISFIFFLVFISIHSISQVQFGFEDYLKRNPQKITTFCISNSTKHLNLLEKEGVKIKYSTTHYLFISATANWIDEQKKIKAIDDFYFEFAPPMALSDTALVLHHVKDVHNGFGLDKSYQGENVIIGIVDQGLDWNHPDFKDSNGNTRVLRYWDHSVNSGNNTPQPYNYGVVWNSDDINNNICTSTENSTAHGTTVTGIAASNGRANGTNTGMAPKSSLIVVETDFNLANWTLTIADACDYIFSVADSLGMPAVVNLSLGTYLGSHDGNDPASEYIETLLDSKEGRIVVSAAGNSGAKGKYHVHADIDNDTSFVWFANNPSSSALLGPNHIYFDLWSDTSSANFSFAYGANLTSLNYSERGTTSFSPAMSSLNTPLLDTIFNSSGQVIATIETYTELENGNFHLEGYFSSIDSTDYLFSLKTFGNGSYDLWSGAWLGLNDIISQVPTSSQYPPITHYHYPDSLQTIVSSWNCSEKVISVGNVRNRHGHIDANGNYYTPANDNTPVGKRSPNSSRGPNRHSVLKPDVCASGDVTLASAPIWLLNNPGNNSLIDSGGWHARNGGTSMASPVVAGIAALYLEKCRRATYSNFKTDLINTVFTDNFTGAIPNINYGYGKPHAKNLLNLNSFSAAIIGDDSLCTNQGLLSLIGSETLTDGIWSDGNIGLTNSIESPGQYVATAYNLSGCAALTDTFDVVLMDPLPMLPIIQSGTTLATLSLTNYQWTLNGVDIPGATSSTLEIEPPYGVYTCYCTSEAGCISETEPYSPNISGLMPNDSFSIQIYPNPSQGVFNVLCNEKIEIIEIFGSDGKLIKTLIFNSNSAVIDGLSSGIYHLVCHVQNEKFFSKIIRI